MTKKALGRGIGTLIPAAPETSPAPIESKEQETAVDISQIIPNRFQPREVFEDSGLVELADSIRVHGVIQPVIVRRLNDGAFELIAGERRWRASQIAGLKKIPVVIRDSSDEKSLEIALIENLQRENLNPIEAARGYQRLLKEFNLTQEDVSTQVGKERSTVANYLRLLTLPEKVMDYLSRFLLTPGHAKAILSLSGHDEQVRFADLLVNRAASVREAELWSRDWGAKKKKKKRVIERRDPSLKDVEERLQRMLGTRIRILTEKKGGKIIVEYYSVEDLNRILEVVEGK